MTHIPAEASLRQIAEFQQAEARREPTWEHLGDFVADLSIALHKGAARLLELDDLILDAPPAALSELVRSACSECRYYACRVPVPPWLDFAGCCSPECQADVERARAVEINDELAAAARGES